MKIIGLYGHSNCGKTQTLNFLREMLRQKGESLSKNAPHQDDEPETFLYHGKVVCVAPGGDNEECIKANIRYFTEKQCDIAISASRTKGGGVNALNAFALQQGTTVDWHPKSYEYNLSPQTQELCNQETAQFLMNQLVSHTKSVC